MPDERYRYKLPPERHEAIFQTLRLEMMENSQPNERPRCIILGGQPGAGKSRLIFLAARSYFPTMDVAVINGDDYRAAHPQAAEILARDDKQYAEFTDPDVRVWTSRLFEATISGRRNIIFEATMRNEEPLMTTLNALKGEGYCIDLMAMAVSEKVSRLGIVSRYEEQKALYGSGRWTEISSHDEAFEKMPDTVQSIEERSPIHSISVYNRAGELLYSNIETGNGLRRPVAGAGAKAAILEERARAFSAQEEAEIARAIDEVRMKMQKRGAPAKEVAAIMNILTGKR